MEINHKNLKYISGPISIVKLKGKLNNIEKNILLFGDNHSFPNFQTECNDPGSVTIKQYINDIFTKTEVKIDFFLELEKLPNEWRRKESYTGNYIEQLGIFFMNNKDNYKNVRFHYSDIRNDDNLAQFVYGYSKQIENFLRNTFFFIDEIIYILDYIEKAKEYINIVISGLKKTSSQFKKIMEKEYPDSYQYHFMKDIYKIFYKNKNKNVENNIRGITKILLKNLINDINSFKKECISIKNKLESNLNYSLKEEIKISNNFKLIYYNLSNKLQIFFTTINDLYILRRALDKDYIKNIVIYTGHRHTVNLLNILINNFNFEMVNSYVSNNNKLYIDKNYIKNINEYYFKKNFDTEYKKNELINQCVDISKFKKPLI